MAAVVVNYNTRDLLRSCLESVRAEGMAEVVVVDNASTDGSPGMVRSEFPEVRLLANRHNPGYAGGANQGIAACRAPYVLLLNGDTQLRPGAAAALAGWLDRHPRAALAGPRLVNPDGSLQSSCYPYLTPLNVLVLNTWLNRAARLLPGLRRRYLPTWRGTPAQAGCWVKGAALAIARVPVKADIGLVRADIASFRREVKLELIGIEERFDLKLEGLEHRLTATFRGELIVQTRSFIFTMVATVATMGSLVVAAASLN